MSLDNARRTFSFETRDACNERGARQQLGNGSLLVGDVKSAVLSGFSGINSELNLNCLFSAAAVWLKT